MIEDGLAAGGHGTAAGIGQQEAVLFREKEAGGQGVDAYARAVLLGHMHGQPLGEIGDGGFGGAIGGGTGLWAARGPLGYGDKAPLPPPGPAPGHEPAAAVGAGEMSGQDAPRPATFP